MQAQSMGQEEKRKKKHNHCAATATAKPRNILVMALCQAVIHILHQIGRNHATELLNIAAIDALWKSKRSVYNTSVQCKETLRNQASARVLRVQRRDSDCLFAVVVELVVDGTHGEDGALVLVQLPGDFGLLTGCHKAVLKYIAEMEVAALDESHPLIGTGVNVRSVDPTGLNECHCSCKSKTGQDGKCIDVSRLCCSTLCLWARCCIMEDEGRGFFESFASDESSTLSEKSLEALDDCWCRAQIAGEESHVLWRG